VRRKLERRANALPGRFECASIGRAVVDGNDAHQVAWHLAQAIDAMNSAMSCLGFAKRTGGRKEEG
jgi:hypothetical protein